MWSLFLFCSTIWTSINDLIAIETVSYYLIAVRSGKHKMASWSKLAIGSSENYDYVFCGFVDSTLWLVLSYHWANCPIWELFIVSSGRFVHLASCPFVDLSVLWYIPLSVCWFVSPICISKRNGAKIRERESWRGCHNWSGLNQFSSFFCLFLIYFSSTLPRTHSTK